MPSRPVLIGRGLVTHPPHTPSRNSPKTKQSQDKHRDKQKCHRVHYPESEPTNPPPKTRPTKGRQKRGHRVTCSQQNNGSPRYGGHSGRETPGPIPNPEVKPASANGTAPDRMWESRTPPNIISRRGHRHGGPFCMSGVGARPLAVHSSSSRTPRPQPVPAPADDVGDRAEAGGPGGDQWCRRRR